MSKRKKAVEHVGRSLEANADLETFTDVTGAVNYLKKSQYYCKCCLNKVYRNK